MKSSMFEVSAYVIFCLSVGHGAGGGRTDTRTDTQHEEM